MMTPKIASWGLLGYCHALWNHLLSLQKPCKQRSLRAARLPKELIPLTAIPKLCTTLSSVSNVTTVNCSAATSDIGVLLLFESLRIVKHPKCSIPFSLIQWQLSKLGFLRFVRLVRCFTPSSFMPHPHKSSSVRTVAYCQNQKPNATRFLILTIVNYGHPSKQRFLTPAKDTKIPQTGLKLLEVSSN